MVINGVEIQFSEDKPCDLLTIVYGGISKREEEKEERAKAKKKKEKAEKEQRKRKKKKI